MDATVFQYGIPIKYIVHWLYHWCLQKNAANKKRWTFGRDKNFLSILIDESSRLHFLAFFRRHSIHSKFNQMHTTAAGHATHQWPAQHSCHAIIIHKHGYNMTHQTAPTQYTCTLNAFIYTVQSAVLYRYNCSSMNIMYVPTLSAWLIFAPASNSVLTTSRCPFSLAPFNGLQPFCNTNVIITRGWTSGGGCWHIIHDRCNISVN